MTLSITHHVQLYDINHKPVATVPFFVGADRVPTQIDEHSVFYSDCHHGYRKPVVLDLRMYKFVECLDGGLFQASTLHLSKCHF